jgi:hypothetical protein
MFFFVYQRCLKNKLILFFFFFFLEYPSGVKRIKRTLSPTTSTSIFINGNDDNSEQDDDEDDEDDERDSSSNPTTMSPKTILTCPICGSTYHRLGHLLRHGKRKHHIDLSNYDGLNTFDMLTTQTNQIETSDIELNKTSTEQIISMKTEDINSSKKLSQQSSKLHQNSIFFSSIEKKTNSIFFF